MKVVFWLSAVAVTIGELFILQGFINVYYKNYNGGRESSSGSIIYYLFIGLAILLVGFSFYLTGHLKIATLIMAAPIILYVLFIFFRIILPLLMGGRMQ